MEEAVSLLERPVDEYDPNDNNIFKPILDNVTMRTAVSEVWELGNYVLLKLLGSVHNDDMTIIMSYILKWVESGSMSDHMEITKIRGVVKALVDLVNVVDKGLSRRISASKRRSTGQSTAKSEPAGPPARGIRRSISASSLSVAHNNAATSKPSRQTTIGSLIPSADENVMMADALRDSARDKLRALVNALKGILNRSNPESKDIMDRLTFAMSMENGFFWDDAYASDSLDDMARSETCKSVLPKLHGVVACHPDEVEPKSKEARRRLVRVMLPCSCSRSCSLFLTYTLPIDFLCQLSFHGYPQRAFDSRYVFLERSNPLLQRNCDSKQGRTRDKK